MGLNSKVRSEYRKLINSITSDGLSDVQIEAPHPWSAVSKLISQPCNDAEINGINTDAIRKLNGDIIKVTEYYPIAAISKYPDTYDQMKEMYTTVEDEQNSREVRDRLNLFSLIDPQLKDVINSAGDNFDSYIRLGSIMRPEIASGDHTLVTSGGLPLGVYEVTTTYFYVDYYMININNARPESDRAYIREQFSNPRQFLFINRSSIPDQWITNMDAEVSFQTFKSTFKVVKANQSSSKKKPKKGQAEEEMIHQEPEL